jgi:Flp pilus assembly protein TadG
MMTRFAMFRFFRPAQFVRSEEGASTIPAILFLPLLLAIMFSSVELGLLNMRQLMLDRGLDETVRILRIGETYLPTDQTQAITTLKKSICNNIAFISSCTDDLTIEIFQVDRDVTVGGTTSTPVVTRNWFSSGAGTTASCTDRNLSDPITVTLNRATPNDLMLIRACLKVDPIMPTFALGAILHKDTSGMVALVSTTAWVREPYYGTMAP